MAERVEKSSQAVPGWILSPGAPMWFCRAWTEDSREVPLREIPARDISSVGPRIHAIAKR